MADEKTLTLAEQYALKENIEKPIVDSKPTEATEVESPVNASSEEVVAEKAVDTPASAAEESSDAAVEPVEEKTDTPTATEESSDNAAAAEESTETTEQEASGDEEVPEEKPEIKIETAPADFRFPTTNQSRHCFTRYIEYHRCIAAKGEGAPECDRFAKYYRSLCPGEWVDRWNEQRENGTFPGPL